MKILAVILAYDKTNKYTHIIGGHPLIYYVLQNALESVYITDVIVFTDCHEVKIIAEQMEIKCILDNIKSIKDYMFLSEQWNYIININPFFVTIKTTTIDSAIKYIIDNDLDVLKSVTNILNLKNEDVNVFEIKKTLIKSEQKKIDKEIGTFTLSESELQYVSTFSDIRSIEAILNKIKVAIYVNGNNKRGMGHIYRALELAEEFPVNPDIYYDINQTDAVAFGNTRHNLIGVNGIAELYEYCKKEKYTIFINDILTTSIDYMIALRSVLPFAKIINFEDEGEGIIKADLVFNALYSESHLSHVKVGEKYYIAGKKFLLYQPIKIKDVVKKVFISFGGADPQNYTDRLLNIICKPQYKDYQFVIALGRAKHNVDTLLSYNKYENIEVFYDVTNMPELMTSCDIGVTSRGRTGYELAILGIPSIAMAQNKREENHRFVSNENGFTYIGLNPGDEIIESNLNMYLKMSKQGRQRFQEMLLSHDLRNGRRRVMGLINNL